MQALVQSPVEIWQGFRALSDPLRIRIVELLQSKELCVCELCEALDTSQSKLSFHLKNLKDANLVIARQQGRWMYYRLNVQQFATLESYLSDYKNSQFTPAEPCC
ncbi:transcriptional regulator, ArsR family [[Leptolyngbya] sp. PCC 7376]|uniref:ArsR/SmtB family transcription factor n=1 Tax=[Leptolyngbya] sp. PCC 7376 TaxID=111781 RepID=UPI00029F23E9|nr:metalloregulator ArsR/SmtB family transcription factor [[Leptolyngbya] sp. PCC 7376]AFY37183.1 transcriptional regulator, ArsR family [[Leptolyngbya] sp. PCC 7376]